MRFALFGKKNGENTENAGLEYGGIDETVIRGKDSGRDEESGQFLVDRLEQLIDLAKETEELKAEYRVVNEYLNDIQMLENMPAAERKPIEETALNLVSLNEARTEFLNSEKKISDAQFAQMEREGNEIPGAIQRLSTNETYRDTLLKDLKYLDREKSEWQLRKKYLHRHKNSMKTLLYILTGIAITAALVLLFLQFVMEINVYYAWLILVFVTAVLVCVSFLRMQSDASEELAAERSINRAITLANKIKIKYVGVANAVDYACKKFHVKNAKELSDNWDYYLDAVREKQKYQQTSDDLDYFNGRLVRQLSAYRFYDASKWVSQAHAIIDAREMVEIKHEMIGRRQMLRSQIEYNTKTIAEQKVEAERLLPKAGEMRPQVEEIITSINKLTESEQ